MAKTKTKKRLKIDGKNVIINLHLELIGGIIVEKAEIDELGEGMGKRGYFNFYAPVNKEQTEHSMIMSMPESVMQSFIQETLKKSIKNTAVLMDDRKFNVDPS